MKRTLSLLLVLVMLLVLCACGNETGSATVDPSQETSASTEETSTGTTDSTQATGEEETTAPTQDSVPAPSEENNTDPTEKPTEVVDPTEETKPAHTHAYSAATCTQPKKCACGATDGSALGHSYSAATCTAAKKCSRCGATDGSALGHNYSDATCTAAKKCSRCGVTDGSALGHKWQEATCKTPKTCSVCKATEGKKADHVVEGTACKWCKQVVTVNPNGFNANIVYSCISQPYDQYGDAFIYNVSFFEFAEKMVHTQGVWDVTDPEAVRFEHNGKGYGSVAQGSGLLGALTYSIENSEIVITAEVDNYDYGAEEGNKAILRCQLLSDGTLKVVSVSGFAIPETSGIKAGTIIYPNYNPYPYDGQ